MSNPNLKSFHWKKGQSGNPQGLAVRLPAELRAARKENMAALIRLIHQYVGLTEEQASQRLSGPDCLQLEAMIQGQINKAKEGDSNSFKFIIEVMCGKIPDADPVDDISLTGMTNLEKIEALKKALSLLQAQENTIEQIKEPE